MHEAPWVLLYWLPYDNDLTIYERPIVEMLRRGTVHGRSIVLVQADRPRASSMVRYVLAGGEVKTEDTDFHDASDAASLHAYFSWAEARFEARKWAVVFLGHAGRVDEFSPTRPTSGVEDRRSRG